MLVKVKCPYKLEKANPTDAGWDLRSTEDVEFQPGEMKMVSTGCQIQVTIHGRPVIEFNHKEGKSWWGLEIQVRGRSSMAAKRHFMTHVGTVDETYNSEIKVVLAYLGKEPTVIKAGEKIAQLVFSTFVPVMLEEVDEMVENRGGFGSSGL